MTFAAETARRIERLAGDVDRLKTREAGPSLGELYGMFLGIPNLRAFWPFSSRDNGNNVYDASGQARTLSIAGSGSSGIYNDFIGYWDYDGATGYHTRADENGLEFVGSLTFGGWFRPDALSGTPGLISKWGAAGQRSYWLVADTNARAILQISADGTNTACSASAASGSFSIGSWHFVVGRLTSSAATAIFVDGVKVENTTTPAAAPFNSTAPFNISGRNNGLDLFDGASCLCWVSGVALSDAFINYLYNRSAVFFQ